MNIKRKLFEISRKMHLDKELTYLYIKLLHPYKSLLMNAKNMRYPAIKYKSNDVVLFPLLCGGNSIELALQVLLSHALNLRGVRTDFILCDRKLPTCRCQTIEDISACHYCYYLGKKFASNMRISTNWVGDFIKERDAADANKLVSSLDFDEYCDLNFKGINIGKYAEAATKRFLLTGMIENKEIDKNIFIKNLASGIQLVELSERILSTIKPSHLILSNMAYLPGVFVEYFSKNGVNCIACDFGILNGTIRLNHLDEDRKDPNQIPSKSWDKYSAQGLTGAQKKEFEQLLSARARGTGMFANCGKFAPIKSKGKIAKLLNIDNKQNVGILFTNLIWDASIARADIVFKDPFEWICDTISWFSHHNEKMLIVKVHPAEEMMGTRQSVLSYIHSRFPKLPQNIAILPPKSEINTYGVIDIVDYGIAYTSTSGLEMAIRGKPVITTAQTHYRERGFTFDATDKKGYFDLLENTEKLEMTPQMIDLANKYGYLHFCAREIPFKFIEFGGEYFSAPKLKLNDWRELLPGADENLDMICDSIISGREFFKNGL